MLDLAGFESLATNGLEQLCFNSANERLQALCDVCVLDREQQVSAGVVLQCMVYVRIRSFSSLGWQQDAARLNLLCDIHTTECFGLMSS